MYLEVFTFLQLYHIEVIPSGTGNSHLACLPSQKQSLFDNFFRMNSQIRNKLCVMDSLWDLGKTNLNSMGLILCICDLVVYTQEKGYCAD